MAETIRTYQEFWPYYLAEHSKPATRLWHITGTGIALILLALAVITLNPWLLAAALVSGYFFAWVSHFFVEHNRPATFRHPWWSLISDFRMFFLFLAGRLEAELRRYDIG